MKACSKEMIGVLIVEDEPPVARFIQTLVKKDPAFEVCGICMSTEDAIDYLEHSQKKLSASFNPLEAETAESAENLPVQLIISDIKMAGESGLVLTEYVKEHYRNMHIILVTGYKLFEYAKQAVDLHADAFLTKPINANEFYQVLNRIKSIYRKESAANRMQQLQEFFDEKREEDFLSLYSQSSVSMMIIQIREPLEKLFEILSDYTKVTNQSEHTDKSNSCDFVKYKDCLILLHNKTKQEHEQFYGISAQSDREQLFDRVLLKVSNMRSRVCTKVILQVHHLPMTNGILHAIRHLCRDSIGELCIPGKLSKKEIDVKGLKPEELEENIISAKTVGQAENDTHMKNIQYLCSQSKNSDVFGELNQLFIIWKQQEASVSFMRRELHHVTEYLYMNHLTIQDALSINDQVDDVIGAADSYEDAKVAIGNLYFACLKKEEQGEIRASRTAARDKLLYEEIWKCVEENWNQNLSLQEICDEFHVSAPYVRKIFQSYTGKSYNEYVIDRKVNYAAEYIKTHPSVHIKDLAEMLGYEPLYFGTIFKKKMGVQPSQYSKKRS